MANKLVRILLFLMLFCGSMFVYLDYHENVHKEIYRSYGITSDINYFDLDMSNIWRVTATTTTTNNVTCNQFCITDQNNADNIGYHTAAIIGTLWIVAVFLKFE